MSSTAGNWMTDLANRATGTKVSFTNAGGAGNASRAEEAVILAQYLQLVSEEGATILQ